MFGLAFELGFGFGIGLVLFIVVPFSCLLLIQLAQIADLTFF